MAAVSLLSVLVVFGPVGTSPAGDVPPVFSRPGDPLASFPAQWSGVNTNLALVPVVGRDDGRFCLRPRRIVREGGDLLAAICAAGGPSVFWGPLPLQVGSGRRPQERASTVKTGRFCCVQPRNRLLFKIVQFQVSPRFTAGDIDLICDGGILGLTRIPSCLRKENNTCDVCLGALTTGRFLQAGLSLQVRHLQT